jgi:hypothetical protein
MPGISIKDFFRLFLYPDGGRHNVCSNIDLLTREHIGWSELSNIQLGFFTNSEWL